MVSGLELKSIFRTGPVSPQLANLHTRASFFTSESKRSLRLAASLLLSHFSSAFSKLCIVLRMLRT